MTESLLETTDIEASEYSVVMQEKDAPIVFDVDKARKQAKILLAWESCEPGKRYRIFAGVKKEDGEFISYCLNLPGAVSCGDSLREAIENLREAVAGCIGSYLDAGKQIPWIEASGSKDEYDFAEWIDVDV